MSTANHEASSRLGLTPRPWALGRRYRVKQLAARLIERPVPTRVIDYLYQELRILAGAVPTAVEDSHYQELLGRLRALEAEDARQLRARLGPAPTHPVEPHLLARITQDPAVMGGHPCIRGLRVTVATIVGLLAAGRSEEEILAAYPYLEREDLQAARSFAATRSSDIELPPLQPT